MLSILIPCLNEEKTISRAIEVAYSAGKKFFKDDFELLVADNGSTDKSVHLIEVSKKARLVRVPIKGYGAALHWGIMHAKGDYVFFADADLSYDFMELKKFLDLINNGYDLILGSRLKGRIYKGAMPPLNRYLGTPLLTWLIRVMYGIRTTDCNSGMRLVKKSFYKKLHMKNSGMEWASELLLRTALIKGKYSEVPIKFYKDKRGSTPHLARWADGWRHLKAIILIKPNFLFIPFIVLCILTFISLVKLSLDFVFFFGLFSGALFLSILAAKLLKLAIDDKQDRILRVMNKVSLVGISAVGTSAAFISLFVIPGTHIGTKLFIVSIVAVFNIWVFFIETIKTHLVERLPEDL